MIALRGAKARVAADLRSREDPLPAPLAIGIWILAAQFEYSENEKGSTSPSSLALITAPEERIEPAGNTALLGAKLVLFGNQQDDELRQIRARMQHISLAASPAFHDIFIRETGFPT